MEGIRPPWYAPNVTNFQARNAIREVGKVLGLPAHILDRMAKTVSHYGGSHAR